jgi:hypothetical protein
MNKRIFLIIISCVTIACIIIGACIHLRFSWPAFSSVRRSVSKAVEKSFEGVDDYDDYDFVPETRTFETDLQVFDSIKIDANVMGVSVERGNRFGISGTYAREALKPSFSVSGATLKITQPHNKIKLVTNGNCKIVITIPYGINLESVDINVDVGAVALKGIDLEDAQINTDVGAIAVENVEFRELRANSDVGAVSVELAQPISEYNIDAKSDVGAIQVNGSNAKRKYSQTGSTNKRIKIKTDVGGIDIK